MTNYSKEYYQKANKSICTFLDWEVIRTMSPDLLYRYAHCCGPIVHLSQVKFRTSRDWLNLAIEKIAGLESYRETQPYQALVLCPVTTPILTLYSRVVTFIEFYNNAENGKVTN